MVSVLISDLIPILQQPGLMPGMEEERQKLLQLFTAILPILPHAEELVRAAREEEEEEEKKEEEEEVKTWLRDLRVATYKADDIVDEFIYATLQAEAETNRHQSGDKVRTSIFSLCKLISGRRLPSMEGIMRERLTEIVIRMENLVERSTGIISQQGPWLMSSAEGWQDPNLSSLKEIDPIIVGRDEEKEEIVHQLLDLCHIVGDNISVLPIFGAEFDVGRIAKSVIDQVIGKD